MHPLAIAPSKIVAARDRRHARRRSAMRLLAILMLAGCGAHASSRSAPPAEPSAALPSAHSSAAAETNADESALRTDAEGEPGLRGDPTEAIAREDARLRSLAADPVSVAEGRATYAANCAPCHRDDGGGIIGPNLTDDFALHGAAPSDLRRVVAYGVGSRGMPAWARVMPERVDGVVAYLLTLSGAHVAGRPPQGNRVVAPASNSTTGNP